MEGYVLLVFCVFPEKFFMQKFQHDKIHSSENTYRTTNSSHSIISCSHGTLLLPFGSLGNSKTEIPLGWKENEVTYWGDDGGRGEQDRWKVLYVNWVEDGEMHSEEDERSSENQDGDGGLEMRSLEFNSYVCTQMVSISRVRGDGLIR